jgi:hypothetical protein
LPSLAIDDDVHSAAATKTKEAKRPAF